MTTAFKTSNSLRVLDTALPGVLIIEPNIFSDSRGLFFESYNQNTYVNLDIRDQFVQDNHSRSIKGTLRGLHYQLRFPQSKLCRVIQGEVLDVVVDIRLGSPHFGKWTSVILSAENHRQMYVPAGYAHGFAVLSETAEFLYKCSEYYHPEDEYGVAWNDPQLGIDWQIEFPILSNKDIRQPQLMKIPREKLPPYEEGNR